ncbi:MAG TPA: glycosyltransferase [Thermoanaerobaculia bacterium]|nr:glycosyltransferase [Thermoanaerobaculia bacterium]
MIDWREDRTGKTGGSRAAADLRRPYLLHVFSNFVPTGPELRTVALMGAFGDSFRHGVVSMDGRTTAAERLPAGVDVRLLPSPPRAGSFATARRLGRLLIDERPDLVLTYNWGAFDMLLAEAIGIAGKGRPGRRVIHHEEGFNQDEADSFKLRRVIARRFVLPTAHCVVVPSERLERVAREVWKLPESRVRHIPNGIRLDAFPPADPDSREPLRGRLGIPREALVVGSAGSLRPVKNYLRLLEAAARTPGVHVLLVGDGEERPALTARAAAPDLAGRVHLAGYQADPAPYYRAMDVFALTSNSEQMPVCLLEAMAAALPAVATDVGDVRVMLPPEQSPLVVPLPTNPAASGSDGTTVTALAARLAELAADPARRRGLGQANRRRVEERFSFEGMCRAYLEVYQSALLQGRSSRGIRAEHQRLC